MNQLFLYLKNPYYCENQKPSVRHLLFLLLIYFISAITLAVLIYIVSKYFHIEHKSLPVESFETYFWAILLAPIYEEVLLRALLKFKKQNIVLFLITAVGVIVYTAFKSKIQLLIILSVILFTFLLILLIFKRTKIESFIASKFKYFFYASAIVFGLLHVFNYNGNIYAVVAFSLILGGPQIILGIILGYVRMNYGLLYSIILHVAINSTILLRLI